jgi:hypothetical protein
MMSENVKDVNQSLVAIKAIEKAKANGWAWAADMEQMFEGIIHSPFLAYKMYFNHDFAKAFWGEENFTGFWSHKTADGTRFMGKTISNWDKNPTKVWQYHLEKMVLEEHPIMYLKQFV